MYFFFTIVIVLLITLLIGLHFYLNWRYEENVAQYRKRNVQYVSFGNFLLDMFTKERPELKRHVLIRKMGKVFGFNLMGTTNIMIAEPELIQTILNKEFTNFTDRRIMKFMNVDAVFSNMLLTSSGEQWKRLRAIITPTFSAGKLKRMKYCIDDTVKTLLNNLEESTKCDQIQNLKPFFSSFTMDTIIRIAFGLQVDSLVDTSNPLTFNAKKIFSQDMNLSTMFRTVISILLPKVAKAFKLRISDSNEFQFFYQLSSEIIKKKRDEMKNDGDGCDLDKGSNFIELMLEAEEVQNQIALQDDGNEEKKKLVKYMSNDEIVAQTVMFFIVGFDTTATTLTLVCYFLALHPEVQEKVHQEIVRICEKLAQEAGHDEADPSLLTSDSLNAFEYLTATIKETLRLYPPAIVTERTALKDIIVESNDKNTQINFKAGDVAQIPIYSIHRDPEQFPDPDTFNPDRFIAVPSYHKFAYIPFGSGPRNCVARSLAMMELKLALVNVIWKYKLSVCEKTTIPVEFFYQMNMLIPKDVNLKIEKR